MDRGQGPPQELSRALPIGAPALPQEILPEMEGNLGPGCQGPAASPEMNVAFVPRAASKGFQATASSQVVPRGWGAGGGLPRGWHCPGRTNFPVPLGGRWGGEQGTSGLRCLRLLLRPPLPT